MSTSTATPATGWTRLDTFCRLDDFQLAMIEQPLAYDDLVDHARLQAAIRTPVCLDESVRSVEAAEMAIEIEACRYINIKPGRVGGLTPAIAIHDMCREAGVGCWVGGMLETAVGARICLALATLEGLTYPADIFPAHGSFTRTRATRRWKHTWDRTVSARSPRSTRRAWAAARVPICWRNTPRQSANRREPVVGRRPFRSDRSQ
ncbi:MAG: enolase C-terminal domain-like protein [Pirellulales bacterium]